MRRSVVVLLVVLTTVSIASAADLKSGQASGNLTIDGKAVNTKGYMTDLLNDQAAEFIKQSREKPFSLYLAHKIAAMGMTLVPEGRRLFSSLTVEENLTIGRSAGRIGYWNLSRIYELFPALPELARRQVARLSGGQQQMVAMGRALMTNPKLLLCDEISLGLAPVIVKAIYDNFRRVRGQGTALVVVEQDISQALSVADRIYCLRKGAVVLAGRSADFTRDRIASAYFGMEEA